MRTLVNFRFALQGLGANKLRSTLTILGIIIGVGAVIIIVSLGGGVRRSTQQQLEAFSAGIISIQSRQQMSDIVLSSNVSAEKREAVMGAMSAMMASSSGRRLEKRDVEALRELATSVVAVEGELQTSAQIVWRGEYLPIQSLLGVESEYLRIYQREIKLGRFFTAADEASAAPVAVLGEDQAKEYFGADVNPIGQVLHITVQEATQNVTVVGVLRGGTGVEIIGGWTILVPLRTAQLRFHSGFRDEISHIAVRVDSRVDAQRQFALAQINTILRARHGLQSGQSEDYMINDTLRYGQEANQVLTTLTVILSLIAGISLIVGSIGLMNIMLVSVSERTWEIGLRRALGAQERDILLQFLAEAVLLALVGGLVGLAVGAAGSYGISLMVQPLKGLVWVTADVVLIALGVSSAVGIAAGIYPAWRAALLQPRSALRHL